MIGTLFTETSHRTFGADTFPVTAATMISCYARALVIKVGAFQHAKAFHMAANIQDTVPDPKQFRFQAKTPS